MLAVGVSLLAVPIPPDPSPVFSDIDAAIAAQDYYKANSLLGRLMTDLSASGVPPLTGDAHRQAMDPGRNNRDLVGLVQQARLTWSQANRGEQPWVKVMARLATAFSSSVTLDSALAPAVRYEQARTRYAASLRLSFCTSSRLGRLRRLSILPHRNTFSGSERRYPAPIRQRRPGQSFTVSRRSQEF